MRTAIVYGAWGQNIGNAFFNLGGAHLLEKAGHEVSLIQDQPAYATFRNEAKGNFDNAFDFIGSIDVDLVVLQGPLFTSNLANIWRPTLRRLKQRGVNWAILSGSFRKFTDEELRVVEELFLEHPPLFVSTRDDEAFKKIESLCENTRPGICSAWFLPKVYQPPRLAKPEGADGYVSFCFDHFVEPTLNVALDAGVQIGEGHFTLSYPKVAERLASASKAHAYFGHFTDLREYPETVGNRAVLRPEHRSNPHIPAKIYRGPNSFAWDEPYTYLTAYANSELTISDRVHACVATMAYGGKAMLHNPITKRHALFAAAGAPDIAERPVSVDPSFIESQYRETIDFLSGFVANEQGSAYGLEAIAG